MSYEITEADLAEMHAFLAEVYANETLFEEQRDWDGADDAAEEELERREAADEADLLAEAAFLDNL